MHADLNYSKSENLTTQYPENAGDSTRGSIDCLPCDRGADRKLGLLPSTVRQYGPEYRKPSKDQNLKYSLY